MRKTFYIILTVAATGLLAAGCGLRSAGNGTEDTSNTEKEAGFLPSGEGEEVPMVIVQYGEKEDYPELAEFLASYYQIPEEYRYETRYYYNCIDLNDDGINEIFAVVIGDYTGQPTGGPALILTAADDGTFDVIESFAAVHTPVIISNQKTNGWNDIIFQVYGKGIESGYEICHYAVEGGYQTPANEFTEELDPVSGTQILSNNLIDDLDRGDYLTLAKALDGTEK